MSSTIDLHLHTAYSDGTDMPLELIKTLRDHGIATFAVCDHDTVEGCKAVRDVVPTDMSMICGVEFSCKTEFKRCHILGLNIDVEHTRIAEAVFAAAKLREAKLYSRLSHLKSVHNIVLSSDDISDLSKLNSVGKPHIARILVRDGYAVTISDAIDRFLTFKGNNDRIDAKLAIDAIKAAGGIPVWAHPLGGEGEKRLSETEFLKQLELLKSDGIMGLECYYSRYTENEIEYLLSNASESDLLVSGGSDYHGKNKNILPGQLCANNAKISATALSCFNIIQSNSNI